MATLLSSAGKWNLENVLGPYSIQYENKGQNITNTSSSEASVKDGKIAFPRDKAINQRRSEVNLGPVIKNGDYFQISGIVSFDKVPTFPGWASQTKYEVSLGIPGNTVGGLRFDNQKLFIFGSNVTVPIQAGVPIAYVINFSRRNGKFFVSGRLNGKNIPEFTANDNGQAAVGHVLKFGSYGGVPGFTHTVFHDDVKVLKENAPIGMPGQPAPTPEPTPAPEPEISEIEQLKIKVANLEEVLSDGLVALQFEIDKIRSGLWAAVRDNEAAIIALQSASPDGSVADAIAALEQMDVDTGAVIQTIQAKLTELENANADDLSVADLIARLQN